MHLTRRVKYSRLSATEVISMIKIKEERLKNQMSQEELARRSGVSRATISKLENGDENQVITTATMAKIAKALDKAVGDIFFA